MKQIKITQGKTVLVDDDIFEKYGEVPFHASKVKTKYYARTSRTLLPHSIRTYLHQLVIGLPVNKKWQIEFKDGNTMNCTRKNLQYIRRSDNTQRKSKLQEKRIKLSKYLGVTFGGWQAKIRYEGKTINIGSYKTELEAANAYDVMAKKLFGDKAKVNNATVT